MSMPKASRNCLTTSAQTGPLLSLLVAPWSKAPPATHLFPQPPKYGDADAWCAMFTIKKSSGLSKPTLRTEQHRVPITTEARPNQHRPSCSLGDGRDDGTTAEQTPRPLFRNRLDWQQRPASRLAVYLRCDRMQPSDWLFSTQQNTRSPAVLWKTRRGTSLIISLLTTYAPTFSVFSSPLAWRG